MHSYYKPATMVQTNIAPNDSIQKQHLAMSVFLVAHIPLALLINESPFLSTLHGMLTIAIGIILAVSAQSFVRIAYTGAYITGCEVLWRMTESQLFWEIGKYAVIGLCILALGHVQFKHRPIKILPLLFFLLLVPAIFFTILNPDFTIGDVRRQISFNLSGPLSLMICACFFAQVTLSRQQLSNLIIFMIAPIVGIATVAISSTLNTADIVFTEQSNFTTSGGFGPNQVSSILGLGALVAFWYIMKGKDVVYLWVLVFVALIVFASQSALTFSRGGVYLAGISALVGSLMIVRNLRSLAMVVITGGIIFAVANYVIVPYLVEFTDGAIVTRFQDTDLTERDSIAMEDLSIWMENPIFGVGVGISRHHRSDTSGIAAHTEFSRLLAEHGFLGGVSIILLTVMTIQNFSRRKAPYAQAIILSLSVWAILFMAFNGMRLVAPGFVLGIGFANLLFDEHTEQLATGSTNA